MQCKDIPDLPILEFLAKLERHEINESYKSECEESINGRVTFQPEWGCVWNGAVHSVQHAMPAAVWGNENLVLEKMKNLIDSGLVNGCTCGCRGDFELTDEGQKLITTQNPPATGEA